MGKSGSEYKVSCELCGYKQALSEVETLSLMLYPSPHREFPSPILVLDLVKKESQRPLHVSEEMS